MIQAAVLYLHRAGKQEKPVCACPSSLIPYLVPYSQWPFLKARSTLFYIALYHSHSQLSASFQGLLSFNECSICNTCSTVHMQNGTHTVLHTFSTAHL